jgi:hypothetical protein
MSVSELRTYTTTGSARTRHQVDAAATRAAAEALLPYWDEQLRRAGRDGTHQVTVRRIKSGDMVWFAVVTEPRQ